MTFRFLRRNAPNPVPTIKKRRPPLFWIGWGLAVLIIAVVAWIGITGAIALKKIVATNNNGHLSILNGHLTPADVKTEGDSRINVLLAGIGGPGHAGGNLTDTLEVYSIDPVNNSVAVVSVPRDLYVALPDGSHGRINAVNTLGAAYCKKNDCAQGTDEGGVAMENVIGKILGIKISYFVRINFSGFEKLVDELGGVDVNVPTTLYDPLYPCPDPSTAYCPIRITAGSHHFNGDTALKYSRSRETSSDFARAARQQLVIAALRERALSAGVLANPAKITQLLSTLGKNIKTDIPTSDMTALLSRIQGANSSQTTTAVLDNSSAGPLTSKVIGGADVLVSKLGVDKYADVQLFVDSALKDPYVQQEAATITIVNASGSAATGKKYQEMLKSLGYNVVSLIEATATQTTTTITTNKDKPFTVTLLKNRLGASTVKPTSDPSTDIVVTLGSTLADN